MNRPTEHQLASEDRVERLYVSMELGVESFSLSSPRRGHDARLPVAPGFSSSPPDQVEWRAPRSWFGKNLGRLELDRVGQASLYHTLQTPSSLLSRSLIPSSVLNDLSELLIIRTGILVYRGMTISAMSTKTLSRMISI